jgi:AMP nucleosidase
MREKKDIVENWLPRYTGTPLAEFGEYILLTNFDHYVDWFATLHGGPVKGVDRPMPNVTADGITLINFGMGSPNAATVMDLLSAIAPKAVLFLGKCGGLKRKNQIGDLILPIAAIRGEGTSNDYLPPEVPALPAFELQRAVSTMIRDLGHDYWTGTVYTTNGGSGSMTIASGKCCAGCEPWRSTWRPQPSLPRASPTTSRPARCFWCPISRWSPRE